jgi:hypothetical protein
MNRLALAMAAGALLCFVPGGTKAGGPFDVKLSKDQQILQALNRLTFGPRPGDIDEIRRLVSCPGHNVIASDPSDNHETESDSAGDHRRTAE